METVSQNNLKQNEDFTNIDGGRVRLFDLPPTGESEVPLLR